MYMHNFNLRSFRPIIRKIPFRKFFKSCAVSMEEEDQLSTSHEKLESVISNSGLTKESAVLKYLKSVKYPPIGDFKKDLEWFNVSEPLSFLKHLKGKVVVLDFFTYCCINCMHILPDLKEIENEFSVEDGLVVIGVHSAKFENEKVSKNVLAAVQRYNIAHPVVNDDTSDMWKKCDVLCWPTLILLGPKANPLLMLMGEGHKEDLKLYIRCAIAHYKSEDQISNHDLPYKSAFHLLPQSKGPLLFPGKITNFIDSDRNEVIAVSDTGNHRILIFNVDGIIVKQIGSGKQGFRDGNLTEAEFNAPQGLVFQNKDVLFVADTENHAIRRINLKSDTVETVAGTGKQGNDHAGGKIGSLQPISSPWDLCIYKTPDLGDGSGPEKEALLIAMAGSHQIWALFLNDIVWWKSKHYKAGTCVAIAGSGREENRNNQYPHVAGFAQPSGLALCQKSKEVYIADSESSSIRKLSLINGKVTNVVGGDKNPQNLFAFGDKDGTQYEAKLQHLLGLAISPDGNTLFVADTYNHKLKQVNVSKSSVSTLRLSAESDAIDGTSTVFNEPAGLCVTVDKRLLLADTNNHSIKLLELDNANNIKHVKNIELKQVDKKTVSSVDTSKYTTLQATPIQFGTEAGTLKLHIKLSYLDGLSLTNGAPQKWSFKLSDDSWSCVSGTNVDDISLVVNSPGGSNGKLVFLDVTFNLVTCTTEYCFPKNFILKQPIQLLKDATATCSRIINVNLDPNRIEFSKL